MGHFARADSQQSLPFALDEPRFALELSVVERVAQAVEIIPLSKAPPLVAGVLNAQGQILPGGDIRQRFGLPPHIVATFLALRPAVSQALETNQWNRLIFLVAHRAESVSGPGRGLNRREKWEIDDGHNTDRR